MPVHLFLVWHPLLHTGCLIKWPASGIQLADSPTFSRLVVNVESAGFPLPALSRHRGRKSTLPHSAPDVKSEPLQAPHFRVKSQFPHCCHERRFLWWS